MTSPFHPIGEAATRVIDHHAYRLGQRAEIDRQIDETEIEQDRIARRLERLKARRDSMERRG